MNILTNRLRSLLLLLLMSSVLVGVCETPKTGFSAGATSLNFYINDNPSVYAYTGETRTVSATVQISLVLEGTFIPGVHTPPTWTVTISGPNPTNPQQTITVATETFTYPGYPYDPPIHPGAYTTTNVSITLPAAAGSDTYTASLTGGAGTPVPVQDSATIAELVSLTPDQGTVFDDGSGNPNIVAYAIPVAASGNITVTAVATPSVAEANLPFSWSLTGGSGAGKYTRTVSKSGSAITVISCTCGSITKTVKIYVYTASITSMPALCVGGKDDGMDEDYNPILGTHKGIVTVHAATGAVPIPGVQVSLVLSDSLNNLDLEPELLPSLPSSLTTDQYGNATGVMTSGKAILPGGCITSTTAQVMIKLGDYVIPTSGIPLNIQSVNASVNADMEEFWALDWVYLAGNITYNNLPLTNHDITWHSKYWAIDSPNLPLNWDTAYGCVADQDIELTAQPLFDDPISAYGILFHALNENWNEITNDAFKYLSVFEGGFAEGWYYWYIEDNDAKIVTQN